MKKAAKLRPAAKKVAPVKATSGAGFAVEDKVAAVCAAAILLRRSPFPELSGRLVRIAFQVRPDGWHFDDLLLSFARDTGSYQAAVSLRSNTQISRNALSVDVKNALAAQFGAGQPNPFQRGRDRLALAAARHDAEVTASVRELCAAATGDAAALARRIDEAGLFKPEARAIFSDLKVHLTATGVREDAATVLASFDLIELDMADFARAEPELGRKLCAELLLDPSEGNVTGLWQALAAECQRQKQLPGFLDVERVLNAVRHRFRLKAFPHDAPDWEIIGRESKGQLDLIVDTIAGVKVVRSKAKESLQKAVAANPVTALVGPSGCGKSSLMKQLVADSGHSVCVWTRVSRWPQPEAGDLANALGLQGLNLELSGLFGRVAGTALLVIDAVEQCVDADRIKQLVRVIGLARLGEMDRPWRVVLLVRAEDWSRVREQLALAAPEITVPVEPLGDFEPEDVRAITHVVPGIQPLVLQPRLEAVLRKPKVLSLVASHVKAGGTVEAKDLAGESHLALWWWKSHVRTGKNPALRARALEQLVAKQAERMQHAVPEAEFETGLLEAFAELVHDGICVSHEGAFSVQHDLYADWTRFHILVEKGDQWHDFAAAQVALPLWHRAIRLYAIWLLEQAGGAEAWAKQVAALTQGGDAGQVMADLFLEAPLLSAAPLENLRLVWPQLADDKGRLLHRMLKRLRVAATFPNEEFIAHLSREEGFDMADLAAHLRLPYPQYYLPLLVVLHEHRDEAAGHAPVEVARVALTWLLVAPAGWPGCKQAAELAVAAAKPFVEGPHQDTWFPDRNEEDILYQALFAASNDCSDDVARLVRVLAGLRPPWGGEFIGQRQIVRKTGFGPGPGVTYDLPPPWPGGPFMRPKLRFQHVVLRTNGVQPLIAANPALAREIVLACHIPERDLDEDRHRDLHEPGGIAFDDSFQTAFYTRGAFLQLLRKDPNEGLRLVVDLVNHYTARWVEWTRGVKGLTVGEGAKAVEWKGDASLYFAYRDAHPCHPYVVSALMALEKHLLDRIEKNEPIDDEVAYLLKNSQSLAIAGLLVAIGKARPKLLFAELWPLVASPEIQATEFNYFIGGGLDRGRSATRRERELMDQWNALPVHRLPLHEVCRQLLPYKEAKEKLAGLAAKWRELLKTPEKISVDPFTLQRLTELFDPSNWTTTKEGENEIWEYQHPPGLVAAAAVRRKERQSDLMPLMTVPINCRTLLEKGKTVSEADLERFFAQLDQLPEGSITDDDGRSSLGSLADAQCAIVAVLVNLGREWLDRQPEKAKRCGEILLKHLAEPPLPRAHIYDEIPFNMTWENFCAEAAPYFLAKDPASLQWRRAVAELAARPHLQTPRGLFRRATELRAKLGPFFPQLFDLLVWIAAARHVVNLAEDEGKPAFDWEKWWSVQQEHFVSGTVPALPEDWQAIDVAPSTPGRHRDARFGPQVQVNVIMTALEALAVAGPPSSATEAARWHGWKKRLLAVIIASLPMRLGKSEQPLLPSQAHVAAMYLLGAHLAEVGEPAERRAFWEPLLSRGEPAAHYIKYFLHGFLSAGARRPSESFTRGWREIMDWASETPGWSFIPKPPVHEIRELWRNLLGLDGTMAGSVGATAPSLIGGMKAYYKLWAEHDLRNGGSAIRLLNFLRLPSAIELMPDGIRWLEKAFDVPPGERWGFHELAPELSHFLQWAWTKHEKQIRVQSEAFEAFRQLLMRLAAEQDQQAITLLNGLIAAP